MIPSGQYDLTNLKNYFEEKHKLTLKIDEIANKFIFEGGQIDFQKPNNICELLGYPNSFPKLNTVDSINVHCNLVSGQIICEGYSYEQETNIISSFKPNSYFKEPIIHYPSNPIYFPVLHSQIHYIEIKITDENDELIDFGGAPIEIILEIKNNM